ncbi:hypothetical protein GCM10017044_14220 [Kordiimonas sediminis]|uniref:Sortilin N-terminal domain-containing protein n=1 Tax=Kordiimonas sediminis TaxID=1735581 RepID=A0A919AR57_9PROT|nr:glycosyl hydrolase [Kordiimonas sediminis]GHF20505.1 hypothetical protein GCM10017044_14220 [Kordiimonas sediminis]
MNSLLKSVALSALVAVSLPATAADTATTESLLPGLKMRSLGPAFMGGRIADIAVDPTRSSTWYVAVGSGGVWKTTNAGVTFTPVFDKEASYSIGSVTIDPKNPDVVWVGTGENVSGRHVGWGDGVYKSLDGGKTWTNMGLKNSQHIGKIMIDPRDSNTVYVAAEGPLWTAGGDRGLYKTTDGGKTWSKSLDINEDTGITDIEFEPGNPDTIYAAAYERRRKVWALMAGGDDSGIYKSTDAGKTWRRIETGLPKNGNVGKIGLAVTPADPNVVYAGIEASSEERGFYRSSDKGESFTKQSDYVAGGTGPHYYQEVYASPHDPNLVYHMDVFLHVTRDGGKTFETLEDGHTKHSDNHALWIDPTDGNHMLVGSDAGLYESYDEGKEWRHFTNMPISQFYKVATDTSVPFFNILGGAQDLGTLYGPSRTTTTDGVRNDDWDVPLGADGYGVDFDPDDPNIMYFMFQEGTLFRHDRRSRENISIWPMPAEGDAPERWNWDSPFMISPHAPNRIYYASQRLWMSDDRGDSWTPISGDLTKNLNRYEMKIDGRVHSVNDLYDTAAMSKYSTLTAITESPLAAGVLYTGSDDGTISVSENGGDSWKTAANLPKVPALYFINDIKASLHDENAVFAVADAHKEGDFSPYVFVSRNRGKSWTNIAGDLPDGTIVWAVEQDHVNPDILYLGTEFGVYVTLNGGENWHKLQGAPTIPFRDVELQRRDGDLVGASFGRGFYILDDVQPLRDIAADNSAIEDGGILPVRDAWWYVPNEPGQAKGAPTRGSDHFEAENPPFGAIITYRVPELPKAGKAARLEREKTLKADGKDIPFPGYDALLAERDVKEASLYIEITDASGNPVKRLPAANKAGLHRTAWDLRYPAPDLVRLQKPSFTPPWVGDPTGPLAAPGTYSAQLVMVSNGDVSKMGPAQQIVVKPVDTLATGTDSSAVSAFQQKVGADLRAATKASKAIADAKTELVKMRKALLETPTADAGLALRMDALDKGLNALTVRLNGNVAYSSLNQSEKPSILTRLGTIAFGHWTTRQEPTKTMTDSYAIAAADFSALKAELKTLTEEQQAVKAALDAAGGPGWH